MANDDFSEPPRRADSKNPFSFFCRISGPGHLRGPGVSLGRILGARQLGPFLGGGLARGLYRPPPPQLKARPPLWKVWKVVLSFGSPIEGQALHSPFRDDHQDKGWPYRDAEGYCRAAERRGKERHFGGTVGLWSRVSRLVDVFASRRHAPLLHDACDRIELKFRGASHVPGPLCLEPAPPGCCRPHIRRRLTANRRCLTAAPGLL